MNVKMPKIKLPVNWSRKLGRIGLQLKIHQPEIYLALGLGGAVGTTVMACKATTRLPELIEVHEKMMERIHEIEYMKGTSGDSEIEDLDLRKEKAKAYLTMAKDYTLLYAPSAALGALSGTLLVQGHRIEHNRYMGAVSAYNGAMAAFNAYRERVREEVGEEADQMFRYGITKEQVKKDVVDENGKKKKVKEDILVLDGGDPTQYVRYWEEGATPFWERDPVLSKAFLRSQLAYFNNRLHTKGKVYLNEIYDALGFETGSVGQLVGWVDNGPDEPTKYISFGSWENEDSPLWRAFINGREGAYLPLDFNVDGIIIDKKSWREKEKDKWR